MIILIIITIRLLLFKKIKVEGPRKTKVSSLLTLNIFYTFSNVSFVDFEQANVCWALEAVFLALEWLRYQLFITNFF